MAKNAILSDANLTTDSESYWSLTVTLAPFSLVSEYFGCKLRQMLTDLKNLSTAGKRMKCDV